MTSYLSNLFDKLNSLAIVIIAAIVTILVAAFIATLVLRKRYSEIYYDLQDKENRDAALFESKVLNSIIDDYKIAAKGNKEINTQAIIEKNFNSELASLYMSERFIKKAVSLMIILGLLGTFYGLTLSIGKLVELLANTSSSDVLGSMDSVVGGLINSVKGMSVAFVTSLFGITSSMLLTVINIFLGTEDVRESVMVEIEEYLDNTLSHGIEKDIETPTAMVHDELRTTIKEFSNKLEESLKEITDVLSYRFAAAASGMEEFSASLSESVDKFDKSLQTFAENTRDFSEFNHHLRTNIQRMNVAFDDFTEDLKTGTKDLEKGYILIGQLSKSVEELAGKIDK
ncbi:MAG: hypothetical protein PWQ37_1983 [Candidatus Petromonas sp.]|nr:hypothetical protein [Candidatus Petromonas sp.]